LIIIFEIGDTIHVIGRVVLGHHLFGLTILIINKLNFSANLLNCRGGIMLQVKINIRNVSGDEVSVLIT
jgi:hypothetical protein